MYCVRYVLRVFDAMTGIVTVRGLGVMPKCYGMGTTIHADGRRNNHF